MQPLAGKLPPVPRAGFATGNEAEEGRAPARYVHTDRNISQAQAWTGNSAEGVEILRIKKRDKIVRQIVASLNRCGRQKQAKALAQCGEWFDIWAKPTGEAKLLPCPCDSIFCPECANRKARPLIKKLKTMVNRPGRSYWFLTLTVPNTEKLSRLDISQISDAWAELWDSWVFQKAKDENGKRIEFFGGVRSIECVYEPDSKTWHPHIHVLLETSRNLPEWWLLMLKSAWLAITGDGRYLKLQRAYSRTKRGKKKYNRLNDKALREVCKYVTKCADFAGDHLLVDEFLNAFKGVRRVQCFGSFHGKGKEEFCREPGEDCEGIGEAETNLRAEGYRKLPFRAHLSDTKVLPDGTRQLSFAFAERVEAYFSAEDPPWELTPETPVTSEQKRIEFAGAMPVESVRQASLFDVAA